MRSKIIVLVILVLLLAAGCGGPKADVQIFVMTANGMPTEQADALEKSLQAKVGQLPTIQLNASSVFSPEKLVVEIAAGGNSIIIVPEEQFYAFAKQGGYISLDDVYESSKYPGGIAENPESKEKHLYGLPVHQLKWFKDEGYAGNDVYAFIPQNAKSIQKAKQVIKAMAEE